MSLKMQCSETEKDPANANVTKKGTPNRQNRGFLPPKHVEFTLNRLF